MTMDEFETDIPQETDAEWRLRKMKEIVLNKRQQLLDDTDYIMMPDYPMVDKSAYESYRQALRDITKQEGFPYEVVWPTQPNPS
jgi:hypothetical protein